MRVQLGWLFVPEAYITASRQYVAQANSWSLEELFLKVFFLYIWYQSRLRGYLHMAPYIEM